MPDSSLTLIPKISVSSPDQKQSRPLAQIQQNLRRSDSKTLDAISGHPSKPKNPTISSWTTFPDSNKPNHWFLL